MNWTAWWGGWASACAVGAILDQRWGWAVFAGAFAALYGWWAVRDARRDRIVPLDQQSGWLADGFLRIAPDEVATVEVVTGTGEQARFSVWRNQ